MLEATSTTTYRAVDALFSWWLVEPARPVLAATLSLVWEPRGVTPRCADSP